MHAQRTDLNDAIRGCKFRSNMACRDKPSSQLAEHATQELQHTRIYALPISQLEGNFLRNSVKTVAPVDLHTHQIRAINKCGFHGQREIHPTRLQHVFRASTMQRAVSPFFLPVQYVMNSERSPQPAHRSHEACRPQFSGVRILRPWV